MSQWFSSFRPPGRFRVVTADVLAKRVEEIQARDSTIALASRRSAVSKPSVNQA